ncbi:MAG: hypothetical protein FK734_11870 [Asgard group archaeon]|nr:hypothetical protein [Asgard group archaeon]
MTLDIEFSLNIDYTNAEQKDEIKTDFPFKMTYIEISNLSAEIVKIVFYADNQEIGELALTAGEIIKSELNNVVTMQVAGVNSMSTDDQYDTLIVGRKLKTITRGDGNGTLSVMVGGKIIDETAPVFSLDTEIQEINQVSKDQLGEATPGSQYYKAKLTGAIRQVGK